MPPPVSRRRFLATLPAFIVAACTRDARHAALPRGASVVALGDSLTYGTGASPAASWPAVLAQRSGWQVENAGVPGETAAQACERLPGLVTTHRPALVLVLVGGNDFLRRLPDAGVRDALAACVANARAASVPIVLLPVPRLGLSGLTNAPLYAETATMLSVPLVDAGLAELLGKPAMRADPVHLNAAGYRAMAERVGAELAALGFLR
jgi:acyl-CoA hydrolase